MNGFWWKGSWDLWDGMTGGRVTPSDWSRGMDGLGMGLNGQLQHDILERQNYDWFNPLRFPFRLGSLSLQLQDLHQVTGCGNSRLSRPGPAKLNAGRQAALNPRAETTGLWWLVRCSGRNGDAETSERCKGELAPKGVWWSRLSTDHTPPQWIDNSAAIKRRR